ncbi:hypothetical protein [Nitrobacter hamburgensis]|uniref:hypothetical protein n=1 Tax=Nitrobacter hamburgensis TaxID=912 RepID=UPI0000555AF5|nr:hypothetical protein [Nitrobacter hamburgensis]
MPDQVPHFLIWDRDDPNAMLVSVGKTIDANPADNRIVRVDNHTGAYLDAPTGRFIYIMLKLHTDMFADLPGKLFLGLMGTLRRDHIRRRGLRAVDAQAEVRRISH